jgi:hypothetical protein
MATKNSHRKSTKDETSNSAKPGKIQTHKGQKDIGGNKFPSQENLFIPLETYENVFAEIRKVAGISDLSELVVKFKAVEDQNFSLFNYVNEINNEIELHAEEIVNIQSKLNEMKIESIAIEEQRKKELKSLEVSFEIKL